MKTIRRNTFETNSSSCHCVTICGEDKLEAYRAKKVIALSDTYICSDSESREIVLTDDKFIPLEDAYKKLTDFYNTHKNEKIFKERYCAKELSAVIGQLTFEKFVELLFDEDEECDLGNLDRYELQECLEQVYDVPEIFVAGSYKSPLEAPIMKKPKGIKAKMAVVTTEVAW